MSHNTLVPSHYEDALYDEGAHLSGSHLAGTFDITFHRGWAARADDAAVNR